MINIEKIFEDAKTANEKGQKTATSGPSTNKFNLDEYLAKYDVPVKEKKHQGNKTLYILEHCLFDESHTGKDAAVIQYDSGALAYHCFHNSCADKHWADVRKIISGDAKIMEGGAGVRDAEEIDPSWEYAKGYFPYQTDFPWQVFPSSISNSLLACAESCATSPTALAGTAFAIIASTLGRMVLISPKMGWEEPLLVWIADIRASGEGKTPGMNLLSRPLHQAQYKSDAEFKTAKEAWENAEGAERLTRGPEPKWSRSYFASGLTLEGVRTAVEEGHGGLVCTFNELSSFITSQGQYKGGRGDDREGWLVMFDGKPARILRAGKSLTIPESSVSVVGGVQPEVLISVFGDKKAVFLNDGTIFRFLLTYEPSHNFELTRATWSDQHRAAWENLVNKALKWADARYQSGKEPLILKLPDDGCDCFLNFRNSTFVARDNYPQAFRGFIPKSAAYVLRLAGLLHVFEQLSNGDDISPVINFETVQRAISAVRFYLGHIFEALKLLCGEETIIHQSDEQKGIISVLNGLSRKVESQGYITVGDIAKSYNAITGKNETPHRIGNILRSVGLNPKKDSHRGTYEIRKEEIQNFLRTKSAKSACPQHTDYVNDIFADFQIQSPQSPPISPGGGANLQTMQASEKPSHSENTMHISCVANLADIADYKSNQSENFSPNDGALREVVL